MLFLRRFLSTIFLALLLSRCSKHVCGVCQLRRILKFCALVWIGACCGVLGPTSLLLSGLWG